jgi:hypothetical protein
MAKSRTYPNHHNCGLCGKSVPQHSDFLHARLRGAAVLFHWCCFLRQLRENSQQNSSKTHMEEPQSAVSCFANTASTQV